MILCPTSSDFCKDGTDVIPREKRVVFSGCCFGLLFYIQQYYREGGGEKHKRRR